jgi:hypothetical protein
METPQSPLGTMPGAATATAPEKKDPLAGAKAAFDSLLASQKANETPDVKAAKAAAQEAKAEKAQAKAATPEKAPAAARDPEIERLRSKLRLSGAPQEAIEHLPDQKVREWWTLQEQRERDAAEVRERAAALEKRLGEPKATKQPEPTGVPTGDLDLDEFADALAAQFGEDEAGTLKSALQSLVSPLLQRVNQLEGVIQKAQEKGRNDIVAQNRKRLAEQLPQLKENDRAWDIVQGQVFQAFEKDPSKYSSPEEAFDDVAQALYGSFEQQAEKESASASEDLKAQIAAATPTPPESKKSTKKITPMDAAYSAFRVLSKDAEDVEGARRAFNRATLPQ